MTSLIGENLLADVEFPEGHFLRPNGLGGYFISASAISSWDYCQLRRYYELRARAYPDEPQPAQLSATAYGSVMHFAIMTMEKAHHEGREDALDLGIRTFVYYWHPENISAICPPVTEWLPRETWNGLKARGESLLRTYWDVLVKDDSRLLALEYEFAVPLVIRGRTHTLQGQIDRLTLRPYKRVPTIDISDLKTGRRPFYLRYNTQGSMYAYASSCPEFWLGWPESGAGELETFDPGTIGALEDLCSNWGYQLHSGSHRELPLASRRFRWIDLKDVKMVDGGWRTQQDYARLAVAVDAYVRASEAGIYSVATDTSKCRYCSFRKTCAGVGLPAESAGAPA